MQPMAQRKHEPRPPMDLANMREQGVRNEKPQVGLGCTARSMPQPGGHSWAGNG